MVLPRSMQDEVEISPGKNESNIRPATGSPREGWGSAFAAMHANGDDAPLIDDSLDLERCNWK